LRSSKPYFISNILSSGRTHLDRKRFGLLQISLKSFEWIQTGFNPAPPGTAVGAHRSAPASPLFALATLRYPRLPLSGHDRPNGAVQSRQRAKGPLPRSLRGAQRRHPPPVPPATPRLKWASPTAAPFFSSPTFLLHQQRQHPSPSLGLLSAPAHRSSADPVGFGCSAAADSSSR
jgi:hypothetical protein